MTDAAAPETVPPPEIVLRHFEPGDDLAFARALETIEALDARPRDWELRRDSVWHNGDHRIFRNSDEISIQPREGSALVVVTFPKGTWQDAAHGTRHILQAMRMVSGRGQDDDQYVAADEWCIAAFCTPSETGLSPKRVAMATPWEPADWNPDVTSAPGPDGSLDWNPKRWKGPGPTVQRVLDACPTALRWEAHIDDGLPHVRIDQIDWTTWSQSDLSPDAMEILRAMASVETRIAALAAKTTA